MRRALAAGHKPSTKRGVENPSDFFPSLLLFVHYVKETGSVELIELASGTLTVRAQGRLLFDHSMRDLLVWLHVADPEFSGNMGSWTSPRFGLGLYAPAWDEEPDRPPEAISFAACAY